MAIIRKGGVAPVPLSSGYPHPYNLGSGHMTTIPVSDAGGLAQFGAYVETLQPGATSSQWHWHAREDEFVLLLEGSLTVVENDGRHVLEPGDAACWPAGEPNAHQLHNHTARPATYLVVGTRATAEHAEYPDIDLVHVRDEAGSRYLHRDGSPYPALEDRL